MGLFVTAIELKFVENGADLPPGEFKGYGAVFNNQDGHEDVIAPGAFADTLAERAAQGRPHVPMHVMHGVMGGDGLPIGVWKSVAEDRKGLRTHGKISGMNTDAGKLHYERLRDGAYAGQSIGYKTLTAVHGKGAGEPKRLITKAKLYEISLVDDPSNALALNDEFKRRHPDDDTKATPGPGAASRAIASAIVLHRACMSGGDSPNAEERGKLLGHLQDAHEALTGQRMPDGVKAARTAADFAEIFREMGHGSERADALAADAFKSAADRSGVVATAMQQLGDVLSGFCATLG